MAGGLGAASAVLLERRLRAAEQAGSSVRTDAKVLVFDTFGTVVDWRSSVTAEGERLGRAKGLKVDWAAFADAWRGGYGPSMNRVRRGEVPWTKLDVLHRQTLDGLLDKFGITTLTEEEKQHFNRAWHRLKPWPDAVAGLTRLKKAFVIAPIQRIVTMIENRSPVPGTFKNRNARKSRLASTSAAMTESCTNSLK